MAKKGGISIPTAFAIGLGGLYLYSRLAGSGEDVIIPGGGGGGISFPDIGSLLGLGGAPQMTEDLGIPSISDLAQPMQSQLDTLTGQVGLLGTGMTQMTDWKAWLESEGGRTWSPTDFGGIREIGQTGQYIQEQVARGDPYFKRAVEAPLGAWEQAWSIPSNLMRATWGIPRQQTTPQEAMSQGYTAFGIGSSVGQGARETVESLWHTASTAHERPGSGASLIIRTATGVSQTFNNIGNAIGGLFSW